MQLIRKLAPMCMHRSNVPVKYRWDLMHHAIGSLMPQAIDVGNILRTASYVGTLLE